MALTAGIKKILDELKNMGVNMEKVTPNQIKQAAQVAKTKISWKNIHEYHRKDDDKLYDFSPVCGDSPAPKKKVAVQTNVDLGSLFVNTETDEEPEDEDLDEDDVEVIPQTPKRKLKETVVDEEREREAERKRKEREDKTPMRVIPSTDPKILDKYDEEVKDEDKQTAVPLSRFKNSAARVYIVQDLNMDQYVLGVTKSFDIAWDKLRYKEFNDCGEFIDKDAALKKINKDGFVVLKGLHSGLKVIIKAMELEVQ